MNGFPFFALFRIFRRWTIHSCSQGQHPAAARPVHVLTLYLTLAVHTRLRKFDDAIFILVYMVSYRTISHHQRTEG